jgi:hypothetical protein
MLGGVNYFVQLLWLLEVIIMSGFGLLVLYALRASRTDPGIKLAWLLYLGLIVCLTTLVWVNDWAFMRVMSELYILGALILFGTRTRISSIILLGQIGLGVGVALYTLFKPL